MALHLIKPQQNLRELVAASARWQALVAETHQCGVSADAAKKAVHYSDAKDFETHPLHRAYVFSDGDQTLRKIAQPNIWTVEGPIYLEFQLEAPPEIAKDSDLSYLWFGLEMQTIIEEMMDVSDAGGYIALANIPDASPLLELNPKLNDGKHVWIKQWQINTEH